MKKLTLMILLALSLGAIQASADLICGNGHHTCENPTDGSQPLEQAWFCSINENLDTEQLLEKLNYYEQCNRAGGVVKLGKMNKSIPIPPIEGPPIQEGDLCGRQCYFTSRRGLADPPNCDCSN